jgi:DNA-binding SARP family transcriptional activator
VQIRLSTLGRVRCDLDNQELTDLPGQRLRCALLLYLAVERKAPRETIQNLFWPERDDVKGRGALKQTVFELRRLLGDNSIETRGDDLQVHADLATDLEDFRRAVESKEWETALALYAGIAGAFLQLQTVRVLD